MSDKPYALSAEALAAIAKARTEAELEAIAVEYLGRKNGRISSLLSSIGKLEPAQRAALGQSANEAKKAIEEGMAARRAQLEGERLADIAELGDSAGKLHAAAEEWVAAHASEGRPHGGAVAE